jgi:hypothetical protein
LNRFRADPIPGKSGSDGSDKGVIPLVTEELFNRIESKTVSDPQLEFRVEVSYMEIYNEKGKPLPVCLLRQL